MPTLLKTHITWPFAYTGHAGVNRKQIVYSNSKVELLLKVTHKYKVVKAAENRWQSLQSKYSNISVQYQEHYTSPDEGMAMWKEYSNRIVKSEMVCRPIAVTMWLDTSWLIWPNQKANIGNCFQNTGVFRLQQGQQSFQRSPFKRPEK